MTQPHGRSNLGIYPDELKNMVSESTGTTMFIAAQFTIAKTQNQPKRTLTDD